SWRGCSGTAASCRARWANRRSGGEGAMAVSAEAEVGGVARSPHKNIARLVVATSLGNALEWFDISVYAYFAVYISKAFFPTNDQTTALLLTFGTFGLSFLARPIGGGMLPPHSARPGRQASPF